MSARIVSFGDLVAVPWRTYLVLDCLNVGEPAPSILWERGGGGGKAGEGGERHTVQENSKYQVIGDIFPFRNTQVFL